MNEALQQLINDWPLIRSQLHFVRPDWFYAFIPFLLYLLLASRRRQHSRSWQKLIDPQLAPFVLTQKQVKPRRYPLLLVLLAGSLCITALAGPVYKKLPQPVYREQSSLVILMDLSQSMNATDIKPSRLARARLELLDILKSRKTGQTALIVYAADAFVVTPLTDDNATIANLVPALETSMMPAQGSNLSAALGKAYELLTQAGVISGNILVITDGIRKRDSDAIEKIAAQGHRLSIFGIGTAQGGPVPLENGGFLHDRNGAIVIPKMEAGQLQRYALLGGGLYTSLAADDSDINRLVKLFDSKTLNTEKDTDRQKNDLRADIWQEEGHWLLLPLLLLAALWARKGWLAVVLLSFSFGLLSVPQPAMADEPDTQTAAPLIDTSHLWLRPDQKAMRAFNRGDMETATREFTRPEWKASALYRKGDYEAAAKTLEGINTSDAWYNRGNALTRAGRLEEAIKAYDQALALDKNNRDAEENRERVKQALEQMKQQQQQDQDGQPQDDQQKQQGEQNPQNNEDRQQDGQENSEQQQDSKQQDGQERSDQQPSGEEKTGERSTEEQQAAEDEQLKQRDAQKETEQQQKEMEEYQRQQAEQENSEQQQNSQQSEEIENREQENAAEKPAEIEINPKEASITEEEKATEQWLKRIPDDPGGLLRRKFYYQYQQMPDQRDEDEPW